MIVFPAAAAVVAFVFAFGLLRRWLGSRRPYLGLWAVALAMYGIASAALALGVLGTWSRAEFETYWLFGAVLNVPYLAAGELYLLAKRPWIPRVVLAVVLVGTVAAAIVVFGADIERGPLAKDLPRGKEVFGDGTLPHRLAQYYVYPAYFFLLGGTLWSVLKMRGRPELRDRFYGTLLIAAGATVAAIGTGVGAGLLESFVFIALTLLAAVALMFAGFLRASRRPPAVSPG